MLFLCGVADTPLSWGVRGVAGWGRLAVVQQAQIPGHFLGVVPSGVPPPPATVQSIVRSDRQLARELAHFTGVDLPG
ncbi:hypothetical protein, partial [Streptomyces durbertensis]|uniref:hypothetical protein n=1 Tax=Streptomyces durbertensis TaxID=2448886 RepID=UPI001E2CF3BB